MHNPSLRDIRVGTTIMSVNGSGVVTVCAASAEHCAHEDDLFLLTTTETLPGVEHPVYSHGESWVGDEINS